MNGPLGQGAPVDHGAVAAAAQQPLGVKGQAAHAPVAWELDDDWIYSRID